MDKKEIKERVFKRDHYLCVYCGELGNTVDHKHPEIKGGLYTVENLLTSCQFCNQMKTDKSYDEFMDYVKGMTKNEWIKKKREWEQIHFKRRAKRCHSCQKEEIIVKEKKKEKGKKTEIYSICYKCEMKERMKKEIKKKMVCECCQKEARYSYVYSYHINPYFGIQSTHIQVACDTCFEKANQTYIFDSYKHY